MYLMDMDINGYMYSFIICIWLNKICFHVICLFHKLKKNLILILNFFFSFKSEVLILKELNSMKSMNIIRGIINFLTIFFSHLEFNK